MKKLYNKFLRVSENEKITEQKFIAKMATSVLTIFLSVVMLCGTTFAYFTATVTTGVGTISSATYSVELIKPDTVTTTENGYKAVSGSEHTFTLKATGTASNGYCLVTINGQENYTGHIAQNGTFEIKVTAAAETEFTLSVASVWCPANCDKSHGENTIAVTLSLPAETFEIPSDLTQGEVVSITSMPDMAVFNTQAAENIPENCELYGWIVDSGMHKEIVLSADLETTLKSVYDIEPEWTIQLTPLYKQLPQTETQQPPQTEIYIAVEGDTLETVAALYGITVEELCALNNFTAETVITVGMEIIVPVLEETNEPQTTPTVEPSPTVEPTPTPTAESSTTAESTEEPVEEPTDEPVEEPTDEPVEEPTEEPAEEPIEESSEESSPTVEPSPSAEVSLSVESTPTLDTDAISEISDEIKTEESADTISAEPTPSPSVLSDVTTDDTNETETDI